MARTAKPTSSNGPCPLDANRNPKATRPMQEHRNMSARKAPNRSSPRSPNRALVEALKTGFLRMIPAPIKRSNGSKRIPQW